MISGKSIDEWKKDYPLLNRMISLEECFWENPSRLPFDEAEQQPGLTMQDIIDVQERLERFAPYFAAVFPETKCTGGSMVPEEEMNSYYKKGKELIQ